MIKKNWKYIIEPTCTCHLSLIKISYMKIVEEEEREQPPTPNAHRYMISGGGERVVVKTHKMTSSTDNERAPTGKLPRLADMEIDLDQSASEDFFIRHLFVEIMADQLFVARVESETRWQRLPDVS